MALEVEINSVVLPGDKIMGRVTEGKVCLGPGLTRESDGTILATKAGIIRKKGAFTFYLDMLQNEVFLSIFIYGFPCWVVLFGELFQKLEVEVNSQLVET